MRKFTLALLAGAALLGTGVPAMAQAPWQSINERQAMLDQRIDQGVRNGALTQAEAASLRAEFRGIANLEADYRRSGGSFTAAERADLDRRLDLLTARIRIERHDRWQNINQRQAEIDRRIDQGVRRGDLTRAEAQSLRADFRRIVRLEARYRRNGLSAWERRDLDQRMDALERRIRIERADFDERDWWRINARQAELDRRIDNGVRLGQLTRPEAARLRADFNDLVALEVVYRRSGGGLERWERVELNRRFGLLAQKIRWERNDWESRRP